MIMWIWFFPMKIGLIYYAVLRSSDAVEAELFVEEKINDYRVEERKIKMEKQKVKDSKVKKVQRSVIHYRRKD